MIYSQWRPDTGLYDYFDAPSERVGLADDLPVPTLPTDSPIGVPSTEIGRLPKSATTFIGRGETARGMLMPITRSGLGSVSVSISPWILAVIGLGVAWWLGYEGGKKA